MPDGLWLVQFHAPSTGNCCSGVIVFQGAQISGGDSTNYYSGSYASTDHGAIIEIRIRKHSPGFSIFGHLTDFRLILQGKPAENSMLFEGFLEHRELRLQVKFTKLP